MALERKVQAFSFFLPKFNMNVINRQIYGKDLKPIVLQWVSFCYNIT